MSIVELEKLDRAYRLDVNAKAIEETLRGIGVRKAVNASTALLEANLNRLQRNREQMLTS